MSPELEIIGFTINTPPPLLEEIFPKVHPFPEEMGTHVRRPLFIRMCVCVCVGGGGGCNRLQWFQAGT